MVRVGGGGAKAEDIWNYPTRTLTQTPLTYTRTRISLLAGARSLLPTGILYVVANPLSASITLEVEVAPLNYLQIDDLSTPVLVVSDGQTMYVNNGTANTVDIYIYRVV